MSADLKEWRIDRAALDPKPVGSISYRDKTYLVPHYKDLLGVARFAAFLDLLLEDSATRKDAADRNWRQLRHLVPDLPDDARDEVGDKMVAEIIEAATKGDDAVPPAEGEASSGLASPSPSTAVSTQAIPATT